jgi:3',5'-cyclic AMP phosphodiesterase CpdA
VTVRIFHVSDLHFGCADEEALAWFAGAVAAERPDAVAVTGDLTMRARKAEFAAATVWLEALGVPLTIEPGNHDLPWNPITRLFRPYRRFLRLERLLERPLSLPGVHIVPLKTTARFQLRHNWSWGVVGRGSLSAALTQLRAKRPGELAVVAAHHPLVDRDDIRSRGRTLGGQEALSRLAEAGADAVLSGHVHDPFDAVIEAGDRPIRVIGAGTLSHRTRASQPSFNLLTIAEGQLSVEQRVMA